MIEVIAFVAASLVAVGILLHQHQLLDQLKVNLRELAAKTGGMTTDSCRPHAYVGASQLQLPTGLLSIIYERMTVGKSVHTSTVAYYESLSDLPEMDIYPQHVLDSLATLFGMQDIQIGDAAFDSAYILKCTSEVFLKRFLSWRARSYIKDELTELGAPNLRVTNNELSIRLTGYLMEVDQLVALHRIAVKLVTELERAAGPQAAHSVKPPADTAEVATDCPVCHKALEAAPVVHCQRCGAAHHRLCWDYRGLCALPSCQGLEAN